MDAKNKVLILTDVNGDLNQKLQEITGVDHEKMIVIRTSDTAILHPYGEMMRSVINIVYRENIEDIYIVAANKSADDLTVKVQSDSLPALNYLFNHHMPELKADSVEEWLKTEDSHTSVKKSVDFISRHPLIPSHIKTHGIIADDHAFHSIHSNPDKTA